MTRKLIILTILASVAVTCNASAIALAAPAITAPPGTLAPKGTLLNATSSTVTMETTLGTLTCAKATAQGEITENTGSSFKGIGVGTGTASSCKLGTTAVTVENFKELSWSASTAGSGTIGLTLILVIPGVITCHYVSSSSPFTYITGGDILHVITMMTGTPSGCGTGHFKGEFTLATSFGASVLLD